MKHDLTSIHLSLQWMGPEDSDLDGLRRGNTKE